MSRRTPLSRRSLLLSVSAVGLSAGCVTNSSTMGSSSPSRSECERTPRPTPDWWEGYVVSSGYEESVDLSVWVSESPDSTSGTATARTVYEGSHRVPPKGYLTVEESVFDSEMRYRVEARTGEGETTARNVEIGSEASRARRTVIITVDDRGSVSVGTVHRDPEGGTC